MQFYSVLWKFGERWIIFDLIVGDDQIIGGNPIEKIEVPYYGDSGKKIKRARGEVASFSISRNDGLSDWG